MFGNTPHAKLIIAHKIWHNKKKKKKKNKKNAIRLCESKSSMMSRYVQLQNQKQTQNVQLQPQTKLVNKLLVLQKEILSDLLWHTHTQSDALDAVFVTPRYGSVTVCAILSTVSIASFFAKSSSFFQGSFNPTPLSPAVRITPHTHANTMPLQTFLNLPSLLLPTSSFDNVSSTCHQLTNHFPLLSSNSLTTSNNTPYLSQLYQTLSNPSIRADSTTSTSATSTTNSNVPTPNGSNNTPNSNPTKSNAKKSENPLAKLVISGGVTIFFEACAGGHYLEMVKILKQTTGAPYGDLTRRMMANKGILGLLDGFMPWGALQACVKGSSFGFGQALALGVLERVQHVVPMSDSWRMVLSGGVGGFTQGIIMSPMLLLKTRVMTDPRFRTTGGFWSTSLHSLRLGRELVQTEGGFIGLTKV